MALIDSLNEHVHLKACSVTVHQPNNNRLVILQDVVQGNVTTIGARYQRGRWVGEESKDDLTDQLSDAAIWTETYLFLPSSAATD